MTSLYDTREWPVSWMSALVADPVSPETVASRLNDLLAGKAVNGVPGIPGSRSPRGTLIQFVGQAAFDRKPAAIDAVWHAVFNFAKDAAWREEVGDSTYYCTELFLNDVAWDAQSDDEDEDKGEDADADQYDNSWITCSFAEARLFALGYGYSPYAWNALLDGLGLDDETRNSDSMRIGACAQLLGGGKRIKLFIEGGGGKFATPGLAGRYLDAKGKGEKGYPAMWRKMLKALVDEQGKAGERAAGLLKRTHEHLVSEAEDLTSVEAADIIWPKTDG